MNDLSKPQFNALWAAFKKNGAWYGRTGGIKGGTYGRMCERMAADNLLSEDPPYPITLKGMKILYKACEQRWAKKGGCDNKDAMEEVKAALS